VKEINAGTLRHRGVEEVSQKHLLLARLRGRAETSWLLFSGQWMDRLSAHPAKYISGWHGVT